jgi:predicted permease
MRPDEDDLDKELQAHLELEAAEQEKAGRQPDEARYAARRALGNLALIKEETRAAWKWVLLESLAQDLRYAGRMLRRSPVFTMAAVLSLALGIGANTAIFTVVNAVLLKLLPVRNPEQLAIVGGGSGVPYPAYELLRDRNRVFSSLIAYAPIGLNVLLQNETEPVHGQLVSGSYFDGLGVGAVAGRMLAVQDDLPSAAAVAVVSHIYWQRRLGADPGIMGRPIVINRVPFTIVGVAAASFFGLEVGESPDIFVPFQTEPRLRPSSSILLGRFTWWVKVIGRLRDGVSDREAQANLDQLFPQFLRAAAAAAPPNMPQSMKDAYVRQRIRVFPGSRGLSELQSQFRNPLLVLMSAVALVLLITCANLANLLLARATSRRREIALRIALGAGRGRVMRQLLTESLALAMLGGAAGLVAAGWVLQLLQQIVRQHAMPVELRMDTGVVWFTAGVSLAAGVLFGILPALRGSRVEDMRAARQTAGKFLAIAQVALSFVLLSGAGWFVRTLASLQSVDPGFTRDDVLLFSVDPTQSGYSGARLPAFYENLSERLGALPGVTAVSFSQSSPLSGNDSTTMISEFGTPASIHMNSRAHRNIVAPRFFETLGIRLLAGRGFTAQDNETAVKVAIVNHAFAREHFGAQSPSGRRLGYGPGQASGPVSIVGVVADSKYNSLREQPVPMVFLPYRQFSSLGGMTFEMRVSASVAAGALREAVGNHVAIAQLTTLGKQVEKSLTRERLVATLSSCFASLALVLAAVGLFGVMNYAVARRTREIGIRVALGARRAQVLGMVLGEVLLLVAAGMAIGIPAALAAGRLLESLLFGVTATDPYALVAAAGALTMAAVAAGYLPARRACRIEPTLALRHE